MAVEVINTRYEVLETVPSSDTSPYTLHKARDVTEGRVVALKVLPARLAERDPGLLSQLRSTLRAVSALDHPMISRTYDVGVLENGDAYVVSDYIRGITLKERIRRVAPFSLAVAADIGVTIAEALTAAHRAGVVHGRLMPQDVILSPEGQIRVGDFGVGRIVGDLLPDAAIVLAPYLPPEAEADSEPTVTNDIYALGAILYEMLTGVQPNASNGSLPASPRSVNPGIPPALDGITLKALHPDLAVRYHDAASLLADLQAARAALRAGRSLTWSPLANVRAPRPPVERPRRGTPEPVEDVDDQDYEAEQDDRNYAESPNALGIAVKVLFVVAVCGVLALAWFFTQFLQPPPDVGVPNLIGITLDDANKLGHQKNFTTVEGKRDFSTKWPEGQIYAQDPLPGRQIKAGSPVTVYVSEGPRFLTVPNLIGLTSERASRALGDSTLQGASTEQFSETVQKGVVISQTPNPATNVSKYAVVNYVISKGKAPPDPPTNVQANALGPDRIQVSWTAGPHADTYRVTRIGIADSGTVVIAEASKTTQLVDTGLQPDSDYKYVVASVNKVGESIGTESPVVRTDASTGDSNDVTAVTGTPDTTPGADTSSPTPTTPDARASQQRQFRIAFNVPANPPGDHRVSIDVQDSTGTTRVLDEMHRAGDHIDQPVSAFGSRITFRIFVDDTLIKQQTL